MQELSSNIHLRFWPSSDSNKMVSEGLFCGLGSWEEASSLGQQMMKYKVSISSLPGPVHGPRLCETVNLIRWFQASTGFHPNWKIPLDFCRRTDWNSLLCEVCGLPYDSQLTQRSGDLQRLLSFTGRHQTKRSKSKKFRLGLCIFQLNVGKRQFYVSSPLWGKKNPISTLSILS